MIFAFSFQICLFRFRYSMKHELCLLSFSGIDIAIVFWGMYMVGLKETEKPMFITVDILLMTVLAVILIWVEFIFCYSEMLGSSPAG